MIADDANPVGALHAGGAVVVNCAAVADVVPDGQVAVTLQSYKEEAVKPARLAEQLGYNACSSWIT